MCEFCFATPLAFGWRVSDGSAGLFNPADMEALSSLPSLTSATAALSISARSASPARASSPAPKAAPSLTGSGTNLGKALPPPPSKSLPPKPPAPMPPTPTPTASTPKPPTVTAPTSTSVVEDDGFSLVQFLRGAGIKEDRVETYAKLLGDQVRTSERTGM